MFWGVGGWLVGKEFAMLNYYREVQQNVYIALYKNGFKFIKRMQNVRNGSKYEFGQMHLSSHKTKCYDSPDFCRSKVPDVWKTKPKHFVSLFLANG